MKNMKCKKCNEELTPMPGKSLKFCMNCAEHVPQPAVSSGNIIKVIVSQFGDGLFLDPSKLRSLAADRLRGNDAEMLKRIDQAISEKILQELYALKSVDEHGRMLKMKVLLSMLMESYNEKRSYEIINLFAEALGFNILNPPKSTPAPTVSVITQQAPTQQQASPQIKQRTQSVDPAPAINSIYPFAGRDWRVLDVQHGKALIISEEIIEDRAYHSTRKAITWEKCKLRSYLNGEFFNSLGQDKSRIVGSKINNPSNPWYGTSGGNATYDKVFLLSLDEVCRCFGDSGDLKSHKGWYFKGGKYVAEYGKGWFINDQCNDARIAKDSGGSACWWWLRSPGLFPDNAASVGTVGIVNVSGSYDVGWSGGGVRPALWLNL